MPTAAADEANKVAKDNFVQAPPVDVFKIAKNAGLEINIVPFPPNMRHIRGFISQHRGHNLVYVNGNDSEQEQKFTIAHELGHWRLHESDLKKDPNKSILFRISIGELNKDPLEKAANEFAATLLMPDELLQEYRDDRTPQQLAELFGVSEDVVGYRLDLLNGETGNGMALEGEVVERPQPQEE